ncbi:MAG: hypothetical protein ABI775_08275, partial [Pseudonocardiales bacterium]
MSRSPQQVTMRAARDGRHGDRREPAVEQALAQLDQPQVADDHRRQDDEEADRQRVEAECGGQWGSRQQCADCHHSEGRERHWHARVTAEERDAAGADREDHQ